MTERLSYSPWSNTLNFSDIFVHSTETKFSDLQALQLLYQEPGSFVISSTKKRWPSGGVLHGFQESKHANLACHVSGTTTEANICSIQGHVILERMAELAMKGKIIKLKT